MAAQGRDIKLSKQRVEGYRNFSTKLWNAARFAEMNECRLDPKFDPLEGEAHAQPLDHLGSRQDCEGSRRGHRRLQVQRSRRRALSLRLERLLRLVSRTHQAGAQWRRRSRQGRNARHRGLGARPDRPPAAPLHALRHRGAVPELRQQARPADLPQMAGARRQVHRRQRRRRSRLGDPPRSRRSARRARTSTCPSRRRSRWPSWAHRRRPKNGSRPIRRSSSALRALDSVKLAKEPPKGAIRIVIDEATAALQIADLIDLKAELARLEKEIAQAQGRDRRHRQEARQRAVRRQGAA